MKEIFEKYIAMWKTKPLKALAIAVFFAVAIAYGGTKPPTPPPVVDRVEGIQVTGFASDADGVRMSWETTDERIVDGDTFIVEYCERQVPAKTGWSNWKTLTTTTEKSVDLPTYLRNRDARLRVSVYKEIAE